MKIIYLYDALCGWCYGFSPVIQAFYTAHRDEVDFEVLSGGMVRGERIGPIRKMAPYIKQAYKEVESTTGIQFGENFLYDILGKGEAIFSSIPPAIALSVFKSFLPTHAIAFAGRVQRAIYHDGIDPSDTEMYGLLAEDWGLNAADFSKKMQDETFHQLALEEFDLVGAFGVRGFPTVVLEHKDQYLALAQGYVPLERLAATFDRALAAVS